MAFGKIKTGHTGLDEMINFLRSGDNVVWQVDEIADYIDFARLFIQESLENGEKVAYFRFGNHEAIVQDGCGVEIFSLDPNVGFETFSIKIHNIIERLGSGVHYVFDCLSDLLEVWATDLMVGNFFKVSCPYLYELETIAYFALLRDRHSFETIAHIRETTQILLDMYNVKGRRYIHPLKVWNRYSPTMFLPHTVKEDKTTPITNSKEAAAIFKNIPLRGLNKAERHIDYWDRIFTEAENVLTGLSQDSEKRAFHKKLCNLIISKDERVLSLAEKYFSLQDLMQIKARLIGSGFIGGKAVGMLLARKILENDDPVYWEQVLEPHDSFFIGSDVFYTYIVQNGWWGLRISQRQDENYYRAAESLQEKLLNGKFSDDIREQFIQMLEYFGQSPIIVRSSSLLEDGFGSAFPGKYESVFCANQGTPAERYAQFEDALRTVYASTMSKEALEYRKKRGLDECDEQMAVLVQRVSGDQYKQFFFPLIGGVAFSYNSYVWDVCIKPEAGMTRFVFGLGTRAVNRSSGDYSRICSLDNPMLQPIETREDARRYSQHEVDVIDLLKNTVETISLNHLAALDTGIDFTFLGEPDHETNRRIRELGIQDQQAWTLSFKKLFEGTPFIDVLNKLLNTVKQVYEQPVDIEYTVNINHSFSINLVQCRPLQVKGETGNICMPENVAPENVFIASAGNFMGGSVQNRLGIVVIIDNAEYAKLNEASRYEIARCIGRINRWLGLGQEYMAMVVNPGRIGTSTPSLGLPVQFSEIDNFGVLCERVIPETGISPELSFGSHFFLDLVERDVFYLALKQNDALTIFNQEILEDYKTELEAVPESRKFGDAIKVYDLRGEFTLLSDIQSLQVICIKTVCR